MSAKAPAVVFYPLSPYKFIPGEPFVCFCIPGPPDGGYC